MKLDVLYNEDCLAGMGKLPAGSVDSVITDPPYGLAFMGKRWDYDVPSAELWRAVLRVLKPGGHLLSFGGTRTYHRMAVAIEDAGFEIRDQLAWIYGSGFPKSQDVSKAIDKQAGARRQVVGASIRLGDKRSYQSERMNGGNYGAGRERSKCPSIPITAPATDAAKQWAGWGSALKPALEPICLARKPLSESTIAANVLKHGTGALNIDGCRIPTVGKDTTSRPNCKDRQYEKGDYQFLNHAANGVPMLNPSGRWPSNLILDSESAAALDEMSGTSKSSGGGMNRDSKKATSYAPEHEQIKTVGFGDSGGASRYFYCAKSSKRERGECNIHPTVKPLKLMEYLVRLITPPAGIVLDPFMGSGSTALACISEGFHYIGFERDRKYFKIAQNRIAQHKPKELAVAA